MQDLALVFAVPLVVSLALTRSMRALALRCQAMDRPDGWRKLHKQPVPLWGGVAVFFAFAAGVLLACNIPSTNGWQVKPLATTLLFSAGLIFLLGFLDDRFDLRGRLKLLLQFAAITPIILAGYWHEQIVLFNHAIDIGWFGVPLTMLWLVGCVNALNLLDGMDGNASTVGVIAAGAIAAIAARHGLDHVTIVALALAGAIVGFLVFNRPPASIYLGDAGSTVIGLVVGFLCFEGSRDANGSLRIAAPLVILTVPILDSTLAIVRRKLSGRRFDHADRGHIHHRLLERGFNTWQALAIVGLLCFASGGAATLSTYVDSEPLAWLTSLILVVMLAQLRYFGHHEFALSRRAMTLLRQTVFDRLTVWRHRERLHALAHLPHWDFATAWQSLVGVVSRWPTERVELCLWRDERPVASHRWVRNDVEEENAYTWRLVLSFGPKDSTRCELLIVGLDHETREPRYLSHLASVLRIYGRFWLYHPERVDSTVVQGLGPRVDDHADETRHAA